MFSRPLLAAVALTLVVLAASPAGASARTDFGRDPRNVLPPGQGGSLPPSPFSTNQIGLYDGLTPLAGDVDAADVRRFYKTSRFGVAGAVGRVERTGRPGLRIARDRAYDVPHITGRTRADVMFGAGWVTAEDRGLFIELIRGPGRLAALDAPGVSPIDIAVSGRTFTPSARTERFLDGQRRRLASSVEGREVLRDTRSFVAGINAYYRATGNPAPPWTELDVGAVAALVGAVFGKGGGDEARAGDMLARLSARLGQTGARRVFADLRESDDPEAPVTTRTPFPYHLPPGRPVPGGVVPDAGALSPSAARAARVEIAGRKSMSNALVVGAGRSLTGHPLAVFGPQVAYFYPQFLMELDLHGGGIDARGAAFPGASLYVLLGRGKDFAWSATSSGSDNVDQFLERLCAPGGGTPNRSSTGYVRNGRCVPMRRFDAGTLSAGAGEPARRLVWNETVHGPVSGTTTVDGRPYAVTTQRSTRGRETLSAVGFKDLNENRPRSARDFGRAMAKVEFTFNWFYVDDRSTAYFSSGRLPLRAPGTDPGLPTLGTGPYDWRGWLPAARHPQAYGSGVFANWNGKQAPRFGAADTQWSYGSIDRVQLFRGLRARNRREDVVAVMNRGATWDLRAVILWPTIRRMLERGTAPDARTRAAAALVERWIRTGGNRLDRDLDGSIDAPGAAVIDGAWPALADAILVPVLGRELTDRFATLAARDDPPSPIGSAFDGGWYGYLHKDLRTQLGEPVRGRFSRRYCGRGDVARCAASLWAVLKATADRLAAEQGPDPDAWRASALPERIRFQPGLLGPEFTMRWTNRPTFQQVMEFDGHRAGGGFTGAAP